MVDDITIAIAFLNVGPDSDTAVQPQNQSSENPED